MESFLYINMTYDELQNLAKMENENSIFEFLKTAYQIEETLNIVSMKITNTQLTLTLKQ
jgi:hypothetical protein